MIGHFRIETATKGKTCLFYNKPSLFTSQHFVMTTIMDSESRMFDHLSIWEFHLLAGAYFTTNSLLLTLIYYVDRFIFVISSNCSFRLIIFIYIIKLFIVQQRSLQFAWCGSWNVWLNCSDVTHFRLHNIMTNKWRKSECQLFCNQISF